MDDFIYRPRRLRQWPALRAMVAETEVRLNQLVYPLFVSEDVEIESPIPSMPGCMQMSVRRAAREASEIADLGLPAVLLFGLPSEKDEQASGAWSPDGIVQQAIPAIRAAAPNLLVITDVCLCEYMSHGHCGIVDDDGAVLNDPSLDLLAQTAVSHALAGAHIVAPSDMMDGRVAAIRGALDDEGFAMTPILSYAAKYASAFYGPFREAAQSAPAFGDRRAYQMDPANLREALKEVELDIDEGADMVMVKPALAYLDVIRAVREITDLPLVAYNVSGEYAMLKAAAQAGWIDEDRAVDEILLGIRRAGADIIITYHAKEVARRWAR
jgi:porphobilinogen synthase